MMKFKFDDEKRTEVEWNDIKRYTDEGSHLEVFLKNGEKIELNHFTLDHMLRDINILENGADYFGNQEDS